MKLLKNTNSCCTRVLREPTTILRNVLVNELEPVACMTRRPARERSPNRLSAPTLFPEPAPPSTITTVLVFSSFASSTACSTVA